MAHRDDTDLLTQGLLDKFECLSTEKSDYSRADILEARPRKNTFKHRLKLQISAHMIQRKYSVSIKMNDQFDIQLPVPVNDNQEGKDNLTKQLAVGEQ